MIKNKLCIIVLIFCLIIPLNITLIGCNITKPSSNDDELTDFDNSNDIKENDMLKLTINNDIYTVILEKNETAKSFLNLIENEKTYVMNELNGNEKYVYLPISLPTQPYKPQIINAGDIMLFGNNCLVLFYKTFSTSYSYTKIGHIENILNLQNNLGNGFVSIIWQKFNKNNQ